MAILYFTFYFVREDEALLFVTTGNTLAHLLMQYPFFGAAVAVWTANKESLLNSCVNEGYSFLQRSCLNSHFPCAPRGSTPLSLPSLLFKHRTKFMSTYFSSTWLIFWMSENKIIPLFLLMLYEVIFNGCEFISESIFWEGQEVQTFTLAFIHIVYAWIVRRTTRNMITGRIYYLVNWPLIKTFK